MTQECAYSLKIVWNRSVLHLKQEQKSPAHRRINDAINFSARFSDCVQHFFTFFTDLELGNRHGISEKDLQKVNGTSSENNQAKP